jgi:hypothetical protein
MDRGRAYREWGRRGPPHWLYIGVILALLGVIVGLLASGGN